MKNFSQLTSFLGVSCLQKCNFHQFQNQRLTKTNKKTTTFSLKSEPQIIDRNTQFFSSINWVLYSGAYPCTVDKISHIIVIVFLNSQNNFRMQSCHHRKSCSSLTLHSKIITEAVRYYCLNSAHLDNLQLNYLP